ncbi:MAG: tRNA (adenosine(37)-N6)-dimethylallyltransferase MiaA [Sandaracinaceae bacterium]
MTGSKTTLAPLARPAEGTVVVVAGVTAAGKTRAGIALAKRWDGELVGADSVQVVRGFDIGSAKPTPAELDGVPHHLLDVVAPDEAIDAAKYAALADVAIEDIRERGKLPIVVGGTGLWLRALIRGLVALPPVDAELRAALTAQAKQRGDEAMHRRLAEVDPRSAARLHPNDRLRVTRALEVFQQTGEPLGELQEAHRLGAPRYRTRYYVLDREREDLYDALKKRIALMLDAGWVDEVRGLRARWPGARALGSVGYRQIGEHLDGAHDLEEARRLIYKATRIYTRRQRTWFRGEPGELHWTDAATLARDE